MIEKPAYKVPSMAEINAIEPNGYKVVSTFSGAGGSCLGYRMAGFKVVWANEFVPAAQDSYNANKPIGCYLDRRDIRVVKPDEILENVGMRKGELDLFDGSPPCQAFSTAGKREKGWGKGKKYEHGAVQNNEDLFFEYIRILRGLMPKVFVAENVSGLLKGTAKGYFIEIMKELKSCGYNVKCKLLDAQWLGVPQMRQRAIFIGVRNDLNLNPEYPKPLAYRHLVRDALPWIVGCETSSHGFTRGDEISPDKVAPSVPASGGAAYTGHKVISVSPAYPTPLAYRYSVSDALPHVIDVTQNVFHGEKRSAKGKPCPNIKANGLGGGLRYQYDVETTQGEKRKFTIEELKRICAFPDDFILKGTYAQQWERLGNSVPPVMMFHVAKTIKTEILDNL